jgi:succinate-semialdehyde dehydrogenase/glutarate-semialdehyde dehydrogenase
MPIATTNPATGQVLKSYDPMSDEQIDAAIERADEVPALRGTSIERGDG